VVDSKDWTWVLGRACPDPATVDGANFTVTTFARYFVHDPVHHRWDVTGR
jgi:uncharacterized protein YfaQ (DUF2300 family)